MDANEITKLAEKAREATPGPWVHRTWNGQHSITKYKMDPPTDIMDSTEVAIRVAPHNANFIAAANPKVITALCEAWIAQADRIAELESEMRLMFSASDMRLVIDKVATLEKERDEAVAALKPLHDVLDELAKVVDSKTRDEKTGDYVFTAREWYDMHCLLAFAPEPARIVSAHDKGE